MKYSAPHIEIMTMLAAQNDLARAARTCFDKSAFLTKDEANRAIHATRKQHGQNMAAYRCPFCDCWHLTTQKIER